MDWWFESRGIYRTDGDVMLKIPDIRQREDYDCGEAALEAAMRFHGYVVFPCNLSNPVQGIAPDTAEAILRSRGLAVLSGTMAVADLQHLTRRRLPVLCPIQRGGSGHWVVVYGVTGTKGGTRVFFQCPIDGPCSMPATTWRDGWVDVSRAGARFDSWGICPIPRASL